MLPGVYAHLASYEVNVDSFTSQWFLTVFTYCDLPWPMLTYIWTALLLFGRVALLSAALALFALLSKQLLAQHSFEDIFLLIKNQLSSLSDVTALHYQMM